MKSSVTRGRVAKTLSLISMAHWSAVSPTFAAFRYAASTARLSRAFAGSMLAAAARLVSLNRRYGTG